MKRIKMGRKRMIQRLSAVVGVFLRNVPQSHVRIVQKESLASLAVSLASPAVSHESPASPAVSPRAKPQNEKGGYLAVNATA